jgi:hypothetical protein
LAGLRSFWRTVAVGQEGCIPESSFATFRHCQQLSVFGQVAYEFSGFRIEDHSATGDFYDAIVSRWSSAIFDSAFGSVFTFDDALITEVEQGLEVFVGLQDDIAAPSAIAAAGSACWHIFFAPERHHAIAAVACDYLDFSLVDELHGRWFLETVLVWHHIGFWIIKAKM